MKPGDKVACVDDAFPYGVGPQGIKAGEVYTVSWVGQWNHPVDGTYRGVRLAELQRGADPACYCDDLPFRASRFKPVVAPKSERVMEGAE